MAYSTWEGISTKEYNKSKSIKYAPISKSDLKSIWEIIVDEDTSYSTISITLDMLKIEEKSIEALLAHKEIPDLLGEYSIVSYTWNYDSGRAISERAINLSTHPEISSHLYISGYDEAWVRGKFQQIEDFFNAKFDQLNEEQKRTKNLEKENENAIPIVLMKKDVNLATQDDCNLLIKNNLNRVFIVHGHDEEMKHAVARVLISLDLEPIIIQEKPDNNKTLIEKLEQYSDVDFAVVLLSPDDIAYDKKELGINGKFRARQNVILELGYFLGKLSRQCVFVLYRESNNFEIPSDYFGVLYTKYDESEAWKLKMAREMKTLDPRIDLNKL